MDSSSATAPNLFPKTPTLDPERVEMLRELCADAGPEVLTEIIESWDSEASRHMQAAEAAMQESALPKLKAAAHAIKGSCGNMGVTRLAELARELESKAASPAFATAILREMEAEVGHARLALAKIGR